MVGSDWAMECLQKQAKRCGLLDLEGHSILIDTQLITRGVAIQMGCDSPRTDIRDVVTWVELATAGHDPLEFAHDRMLLKLRNELGLSTETP